MGEHRWKRGIVGALRAVLVACVAFALTAAGCGSSELKSSEQVSKYVEDVLHGKAGDWDLAGNADRGAANAWEERLSITDLEEKLHKGFDWTCHAAEILSTAAEESQPEVPITDFDEEVTRQVLDLAEEESEEPGYDEELEEPGYEEEVGEPDEGVETAARDLVENAEGLTPEALSTVVDEVCP